MQAEIRKGKGNELRKSVYREGRRLCVAAEVNTPPYREGKVRGASPESKTLACMTER